LYILKGKRMFKAIFAITIIGIASGAGAAQLTIAEKLEDIMNSKEAIRQAIEAQGVEVPSNTPLSQYSNKIGQITCDADGFFIGVACSTLGAVDPAGGTFSAVDPFDSVLTCRYTAPNRNISGCSFVQANAAAYDGTSWPASTYSAMANPGYKVENNNTVNPACTQCNAGTYSAGGMATSCETCPKDSYCTAGSGAPTACGMIGAGFITDASGATSAADCHAPPTPISSISVSCTASSISRGATTTCSATVNPNNATNQNVSWSSNNPSIATVNSSTGVVTGVAAGTITITASAQDGSGVSGASSNITVLGGFSGSSIDFCSDTINSATLSVYSDFSSICSPLSTTAKFPYTFCGGKTYNSATFIWEGTSCPLVSGTTSIYGNARCSTQRDTAGHGGSLIDSTANGYCYRATNEPSNDPNVGQYCWCQLCTDANRTTCGGWVFRADRNSASNCVTGCANYCADVSETTTYARTFRAALCAAPAL